MKAYRRSRIIDPFIFNLRNTWMWVVNFTSRPLYPGKEPLYQLNRRVRGPHREVMSILERRNLFYPPEFEHQIILSLAKLLHWQSYHGSCMYVCVYIYIYIYARSRTQICTHTYTHTNTHTHKQYRSGKLLWSNQQSNNATPASLSITFKCSPSSEGNSYSDSPEIFRIL